MRNSSASIVEVSGISARNGTRLRGAHCLGLVLALVAGLGSFCGCSSEEITESDMCIAICRFNKEELACQNRCYANTLCDTMCSCSGCDGDERDECKSDFNDLVEDARTEECNTLMGEFIDCKRQKMECDGIAVSFDDCSEEQDRLEECVDENVEIWIPAAAK